MGILHENQTTFLLVSCSILLKIRNISYRSCRERQNAQSIFRNFFPKLSVYGLWDNMDKYCRAGQTTDNNMAHAHCMLDT